MARGPALVPRRLSHSGMISKPKTVKDALVMSAGAAVKREIADNMSERGDYHASWERAEADEMDEAAGKFLDIGSQALHVTGPVKFAPPATALSARNSRRCVPYVSLNLSSAASKLLNHL